MQQENKEHWERLVQALAQAQFWGPQLLAELTPSHPIRKRKSKALSELLQRTKLVPNYDKGLQYLKTNYPHRDWRWISFSRFF